MKEGIILELTKNTAVLITADGEFLSIPAQPNWSIGDEIKYNPRIIDTVKSNNSYKKPFLMKRGAWIALAACLMLLFIPLSTLIEASTYVTLDINPSVELEIKDDKVINVKALNSDAEKVIFNLPNEYQDIFSITAYIINKSKELGYMTIDKDNYIMIGVCENNISFPITEYENYIKAKLEEEQLNASISFFEGTSEEKRLADNKNLSLGKYLLQQDKRSEGIEISDDDLLKGNFKNMLTTEENNKDSDNKGNNSTLNNANTNNNNEVINNKNTSNNSDDKKNGEIDNPVSNNSSNINDNLNENNNDNNNTPANIKNSYNNPDDGQIQNIDNSNSENRTKGNH